MSPFVHPPFCPCWIPWGRTPPPFDLSARTDTSSGSTTRRGRARSTRTLWTCGLSRVACLALFRPAGRSRRRSDAASGRARCRAAPRNPRSYPHPRLQDFPGRKKTPKNTGRQRIAWRQESGGGDKFLAAGHPAVLHIPRLPQAGASHFPSLVI